MKYSFVVSQAAVVDAGLLGKVNVADLCLLHYLRGWFTFDRAKMEIVEGRKYVWLHYERAIEELPLLFNPKAKLASRKNQLSSMIAKLCRVGLLNSHRVGRRLYFRLTEIALKLGCRSGTVVTSARDTTITAHEQTVTAPRDETVMSERDETVTSRSDECQSTYINETGTIESKGKETPPISPYEGDEKSILTFWNSLSQLLPVQILTKNRARKLYKRLADPFWREHWREGIKRIAASNFARGGGPQGWRATFDWFLGDDSLARILEGTYDNRPGTQRTNHPTAIQGQIKAVDAIIATHPADEKTVYHDPHATKEQHEDLRRLRQQRKQLLRQLAGVPEPNQNSGAEEW